MPATSGSYLARTLVLMKSRLDTSFSSKSIKLGFEIEKHYNKEAAWLSGLGARFQIWRS